MERRQEEVRIEVENRLQMRMKSVEERGGEESRCCIEERCRGEEIPRKAAQQQDHSPYLLHIPPTYLPSPRQPNHHPPLHSYLP